MYDPNPWGFFDMIGNVSEWVYSWLAVYPGVSQSDPEGATFGSIRVKRGGNWGGWATLMRIADRAGDFPNIKRGNLGFRLAFQKIQPDTANPEIYLTGGNNIIHSQGIPFEDPGVEAHDVRDGNITSQLAFTGTVDVNNTGTYTLTYTVADAAGNTATATRTVTVRGNRTVELNATVAMDMIWCSPGTFTMGSPKTEAGRGTDETEHNVTLTHGFYLGKYEVTQAQYEVVMAGVTGDQNATPSNWYGNPNHPVENVSWNDVQVFLTRLNAQQVGNLPIGWSYVLPTESQWEYACRAGTTTAFSWGDGISSTNANYNWDGGPTDGKDFKQTHDVGQYAANSWGFFDMHGNVWEWTADAYLASYPTGNPVIDPTNPGNLGSHRVKRGGGWGDGFGNLRSSSRHNPGYNWRRSHIGFRVSLQKSQ
jgi:formylglycine-generating enzyme required for sulfatase activity